MEQGNQQEAEAALSWISSAVASGEASPFDLANLWDQIVPILARHGRIEPSFRLLEKCIASGTPPPYDLLLLNPDIASLRSDTRFANILSGAKANLEKTLPILQDARSRGELPHYLEKPLSDLLKQLGN
jgi:hypothetical protein